MTGNFRLLSHILKWFIL